MRFGQPLFLLALAGAALPVLIHLLTRDRVRQVSFSTLRFFAEASQRVLRRKKFRERLLLATRMAMLALLALAFARPMFGKAPALEPGQSVRHARVVLLDTSASMRRGERFATARALAGEAIDELQAGTDGVALVTFDRSARIRAALATDPADAQARLALLEPAAGGTDLLAALRQADAMLAEVQAQRKSIVLISDCARRGWGEGPGGWRLRSGAELAVRAVQAEAGASLADDLAILEADVPNGLIRDGQPAVLGVRLANFGRADHADIPVALRVGGEVVATQRVTLPAGATVPVRFRHGFDQPGDNVGTIELGEAPGADDVHYFNVRVIPRIGVLIVNGRPSDDVRQDGAWLLRLALAPGPESPFAPTAVRADAVTADDVRAVRAVVLSDVDTLPADVRVELEALLARGGGVLWLPGPRTDAEAFNEAFGELAPCRLRRAVAPEAKPGQPAAVTLGEVDYEHPVFGVFQRPHAGNLSAPRFTRYWEVTDSQLARVAARFADGRPALLDRPRGAGSAMLLANPLGGDWNDLPIDHGALFVSLAHQLAHHLAVRTEGRTAYTVGEPLTLPDGATLTGPDGEPLSGDVVLAETPGLYTLTGPDGQTTQWAVNAEGAEADPAAIAAEEIVAAVAPRADDPLAGAAPLAADATPEDPDGPWWYLLAAVTLLVVGELALANRTPRH